MTGRRGRPLHAENEGDQCEAVTFETNWKRDNKIDLRCPFFAKVLIDGRRLCNKHAQTDALAIALEKHEAELILRPALRPTYARVSSYTFDRIANEATRDRLEAERKAREEAEQQASTMFGLRIAAELQAATAESRLAQVERETIERCAKVCEYYASDIAASAAGSAAASNLAADIRALEGEKHENS